LKRIFSDYTRGELTSLVAEIISAEGAKDIRTNFENSSLIYRSTPPVLIYSTIRTEPGEQATLETIAEKVIQWRKANGKPGFCDE